MAAGGNVCAVRCSPAMVVGACSVAALTACQSITFSHAQPVGSMSWRTCARSAARITRGRQAPKERELGDENREGAGTSRGARPSRTRAKCRRNRFRRRICRGPGAPGMTREVCPSPPADLSAAAKLVWRQIHSGWEMDDARRPILATALRAEDRAGAARAVINREGLVLQVGKSTRAHPAVTILKDSELIALKAWRQLGLQGAPAGVPGRPAGAV